MSVAPNDTDENKSKNRRVELPASPEVNRTRKLGRKELKLERAQQTPLDQMFNESYDEVVEIYKKNMTRSSTIWQAVS